MHCLSVLSKIGLVFQLKGGTSLSKGFGIIHRFSEDIDIRIEPDKKNYSEQVFVNKNQNKPQRCESRKRFFDALSLYLSNKIAGIISVERDFEFDDEKYRNGGIRLFL